jgi:hypothetical protein
MIYWLLKGLSEHFQNQIPFRSLVKNENSLKRELGNNEGAGETVLWRLKKPLLLQRQLALGFLTSLCLGLQSPTLALWLYQ